MTSARLQIPESALQQHTAVLGKTGSGKTSTSKLLVEHAVDSDLRVCILDTIKSDWWGLTSSGDGKKPGLPFQILGGPRGHVPLHSSAGKAIGQLVGRGELPHSIIDMADFEPGGLQRFFTDFAPALLRSMRGVVVLVLEEAHEFAPKERSGIGAENLAIHWAKKLATAGRSKGLRLIVATQRTQALHNAVLGSCETVIAHRLTTPADQKPILEWLKANAPDKKQAETIGGELSSLPTGTAWVCSGEAQFFEKVKFPKFRTYDNTATPTGDDVTIDLKTAPVDLDALRATIGDAVKEAEANDPKALKKRINDLEAAAKKVAAPPAPTSAKDLAEAEQRGYDRGDAAGADRTLRAVAGLAQDLAGAIERAETACGDAKLLLSSFAGFIESQADEVAKRPRPATPPAPVRTPPPSARAVTNTAPIDGLTKPQAKIVEALAFWRGLNFNQPTREQLAAVAGYSVTSGGFKNLLGGLRAGGLIEYPREGTVELTSAGVAIAPVVEAPGMARDHLSGVLTAPQAKIVDALMDGRTKSRTDLATDTGYSETSGGFKNLLGSLRTLGVITYPEQGQVAIEDWVRL